MMTLRRLGRSAALLALLAASIPLTGCGASVPAAAPMAAMDVAREAAPEPPPPPADVAVAGAPSAGAQDEARPTAAPSQPSMQPARGAAQPAPTAAPAARGAKSSPADGDDRELAAAPLIVYQGELAVRVEAGKGPAAVDAIVALAEAAGGHLAGRDEGRVVVKVPSRRFRETMSQVDAGFEVERRNVKAEDVSAEFHDLEVRLENLRATRKRLEQFLEKSATLADTLAVERELERVAGEIDRIQGRLRFLRAHTSMSTLTVQVTEKAKANTVVATTPPPPARRDLALPVGWVDRVGVDSLLQVPPED